MANTHWLWIHSDENLYDHEHWMWCIVIPQKYHFMIHNWVIMDKILFLILSSHLDIFNSGHQHWYALDHHLIFWIKWDEFLSSIWILGILLVRIPLVISRIMLPFILPDFWILLFSWFKFTILFLFVVFYLHIIFTLPYTSVTSLLHVYYKYIVFRRGCVI